MREFLIDCVLVFLGVVGSRVVFTGLYKPSKDAAKLFSYIVGLAVAVFFYFTWARTGMDPVQLVICTFYSDAPVCVERRTLAEAAKRRSSSTSPASPASSASPAAPVAKASKDAPVAPKPSLAQKVPPDSRVVRPAVIHTFNPSQVKDLWTTSKYSNASGGGGKGGGLVNEELIVGGWGDKYYTLLQFDVDDMPQAVDSVSLQLFCFKSHGVGTVSMALDRI